MLSLVPLRILLLVDEGEAASLWIEDRLDFRTQRTGGATHWLLDEISRRSDADQMSDHAALSWMNEIQQEAGRLHVYGVPAEIRAMHAQLHEVAVDLGGDVRTPDALSDEIGISIDWGAGTSRGIRPFEVSAEAPVTMIGEEALNVFLDLANDRSIAGIQCTYDISAVSFDPLPSGVMPFESGRRVVVYEIGDLVRDLTADDHWAQDRDRDDVVKAIDQFVFGGAVRYTMPWSGGWECGGQLLVFSNARTQLLVEERLNLLRGILSADRAHGTRNDCEAAMATWALLERTPCVKVSEHTGVVGKEDVINQALQVVPGVFDVTFMDRHSADFSRSIHLENIEGCSVADLIRLWDGPLCPIHPLHHAWSFHISSEGGLVWAGGENGWQPTRHLQVGMQCRGYSLASVLGEPNEDLSRAAAEIWHNESASAEFYALLNEVLNRRESRFYDTSAGQLNHVGEWVALDAPLRVQWRVESLLKRYVRMRCGDDSYEVERRRDWELSESDEVLRMGLYDVKAILDGSNLQEEYRKSKFWPAERELVARVMRDAGKVGWVRHGGTRCQITLHHGILIVEAPIRVQRDVQAILAMLADAIEQARSD